MAGHHDPSRRLATVSAAQTHPLQDGLGSVRLSVDDSGSVLGTREWEAWGALPTNTGAG